MVTRREMLLSSLAALAGSTGLLRAQHVSAKEAAPYAKAAATRPPAAGNGEYLSVVTPNGRTLSWKMVNGVKQFHLIAEPVKREFAPGMMVNCWGYNGQTPGPTIEVVEGDRVRILVTNKLPEHTTVHWHGIFVPNGMDGVGGLTQPHIPPGKTFVYEFTMKQHGSFMYHPHSDEMVQMAMGMMGFFIAHPREPLGPKIDRDYCIMLHEWAIHPGTARPDPSVMTDFNIFTLNSRVFPGTAPLPVRLGERVRIRIGNLSMDSHPMHLHGHSFRITGNDGGWFPESAQWPATTWNVPVGSVQVIEFIADNPGDWAFHCHRSHHTMNSMGHGIPNMIGVDMKDTEKKIQSLLPDYMLMGQNGMADMAEMAQMGMPLPENTLPMMTGKGPFGSIEMGGMFTMVKVRENLAPGDYRDPGWYKHPKGTVAYLSALGAAGAKAAHDSGHDMGGIGHQHGSQFSFGSPAVPGAHDRVVRIKAQDAMRFSPAAITVKPGEVVRFEVTNTGRIRHEFVIGDATEQKEHEAEMQAMMKKMPGMAMHDDANGISIAPGATKSITWRFPDKPMKIGYGCHEPGHFGAGMVGIVNVGGQ